MKNNSGAANSIDTGQTTADAAGIAGASIQLRIIGLSLAIKNSCQESGLPIVVVIGALEQVKLLLFNAVVSDKEVQS